MSNTKDDGVVWTLPPIIEEASYFNDAMQIPRYLTRLGDYEKLQKFFGSGEDVMIGMLDTGIAKTHMEKGGELYNRGIVAKDFTGSSSGFDDRNGHGTHVFHSMLSSVIGMAPKAQGRVAKVLSDQGSGSSTWIAAGLRWVKEEFDKSDAKILLVNMSLGGGFSSTISNAVNEIIADDNVIVFAAIGNSGGSDTDERGGFPGALESTLGIGALDFNERSASFSSRSKFVDYADFGVSILSCGTRKNQYRRLSGTSMATPMACATAALIIGYTLKEDLDLKLNNKESYFKFIKMFIKDLGKKDKDTVFGYGRLPILNVMKSLMEDSPDQEDPVDPPMECPPSKVVEKFNVPYRRDTEIKKVTFYNVDGSISKEEIKEKSKVTLWRLHSETEREEGSLNNVIWELE